MINVEILPFIKLMRESVPNAVEVFTRGNCGSFARILLYTFPKGVIKYYRPDHMLFELGPHLYDITGIVDGQYDYDKLITLDEIGNINEIIRVLSPKYKET